MSLKELISVSNRYGSNSEYVVAGGGNTSWKTDEFLYIKGSGTELATIGEEGFVKVEMAKLNEIWQKNYSADETQREEEVLADLMRSRYPSELNKRPSVETLLHALFPYFYVVHTHPSLVNGVSCSKDGEKIVKKIWGDGAIWIPVTNPGYVLALTVKERISRQMGVGDKFPQIIFLQNHGVFVAGNRMEVIDSIYAEIFQSIKKLIKRSPSDSIQPVEESLVNEVGDLVKKQLGEETVIKGFCNKDIISMSQSESEFEPLSFSLTPDHIVYYGYKPLYCYSPKNIGSDLELYKSLNGEYPKLAVVKGVGAFAFGATETIADKAKKLFIDDVKIAVYTESFGGHQFMPPEKMDFIRNWEVEQYRASLSQ